VPVRCPHRLADRLTGEQVVTQIDWLPPGVASASEMDPGSETGGDARVQLL
jgi:hypothetical protein